MTGSENKVVSIKADLLRPAHSPKTTGEQFSNSFTCDALTSSGNEIYDPPSNKGKAYTDTDSDGKMSQAACAYGVLATRSCQIKSHNQ